MMVITMVMMMMAFHDDDNDVDYSLALQPLPTVTSKIYIRGSCASTAENKKKKLLISAPLRAAPAKVQDAQSKATRLIDMFKLQDVVAQAALSEIRSAAWCPEWQAKMRRTRNGARLARHCPKKLDANCQNRQSGGRGPLQRCGVWSKKCVGRQLLQRPQARRSSSAHLANLAGSP